MTTPPLDVTTHQGTAIDELQPEAVLLYQILLQRPRSTARDLALDGALTETEIDCQLDVLRCAGLAVPISDPVGTLWEASPPNDSVEELLRDEQQRMQTLQKRYRTMRQLSELYWLRKRHDSYPGIEVISDRAVVHQQLQRLQHEARREVLAFDRHPYHSDGHPQRRQEQITAQEQAMARGVAYRVIYETAVWDRHDHAAVALDAISMGEQARMLPSLPMKLFLIDGERAMVPLDPAHHADSATLLIYPSGLLRALIDLFEQFWAAATPIGTQHSDEAASPLSERDRAIMTLLSAGATDDLIARRLRLSRSTVTRAVTELGRRLQAETRFQAGANAVRRGWI